MGRAMLNKSLIQFSVDGWSHIPSLLFTWGQIMVEVMNVMTSFKRSHASTATLTASNPAAGQHQPTPPLETPKHSWANLLSLLWHHCSFLLGPGAHKVLFVLSKSLPVLCKFWQLCGGLNGDLLQEDLCHTQVCCSQRPCPYGSPLLTCTSTISQFSSVQFCPTLQPHEPQHARPPCPSPTAGVYPDTCPLSQ